MNIHIYYYIFVLAVIYPGMCWSANGVIADQQTKNSSIQDDSDNKALIGKSKSVPIIKARKNKGSIGMNIAGVNDWSTQYPFLNFMKQARPWISQKKGAKYGKGGSLDLDENGWVRSLKPGQYVELIFLTVDKGKLPFKRLVVRYKGKGKIKYTGGVAKKISGRSSPNRDVIYIREREGAYAELTIQSTDPNDYIRDISIVPEKYVELYDRGEIFNPDWLKVIGEFRAIRFMQWMRTNNSEQQYWSDRPKVEDRSWVRNGVPLEIMLDLVNKIGADPWFNIPHLVNNDYIRKFARLVKKKIDPTLKVYVEHSNEVWNWSFKQSHYADAMGEKRWGKVQAPGMQWHGMRTAEICDIWKKEVFVDKTERVHCVMGVHPGWYDLRFAVLDCPQWVEEGHEPCYKHGIDSIAITGYFSGCLNGKTGWKKPDKSDLIRSWFSDEDGGLGKAFEQVESGRYFECGGAVDSKIDKYKFWRKVAKEKGLALTVYEGGQHITGLGSKLQNDKQFIDFHVAVNRDPRMKHLHRKNLEIWKKQGGTLFMHFDDIGKPSKWGSFGALEYLGQETSPTFEALKEFNNEVKCWWDGCE